jgi:hypothetical protein
MSLPLDTKRLRARKTRLREKMPRAAQPGTGPRRHAAGTSLLSRTGRHKSITTTSRYASGTTLMRPRGSLLVGIGAIAVACGGSVSGTQSRDAGGTTSSGDGSGSSSGSGGACGAPAAPCCEGRACDNGLWCTGGVCLVSDGGSGGSLDASGVKEGAAGVDATSPPIDATTPPFDADLPSFDAAPAGLAGFAFIVNDVVQDPMACPGASWEFPPAPGTGDGGGGCIPCAGIASVVIVNTGALDLAYIAGPYWSGQNYVPGGYPGGDYTAGVLAPGAYVDITAFYNGGDVAILGSAEPFSSPDAAYAADEGIIPWPLGVAGSNGSANMYVAEIEVWTACNPVQRNW